MNKRSLIAIALALCAGCTMFHPAADTGQAPGLDKAKALIGRVFKVDGQLLGTSVTFKDLAPALNTLGAMYGIPGAGDKAAAGDEVLLDLLGRKVDEAGAAAVAEQWGPTSVLTNEFVTVEGMDPIPAEKVLSFDTVRTPIYPGPRTNKVTFAVARKQFEAGGAAAAAQRAEKAKAQAAALQLLASGILDGDVRTTLAQALAAGSSSTSLAGQVQATLDGADSNATWQANGELDPAIQAVMPK